MQGKGNKKTKKEENGNKQETFKTPKHGKTWREKKTRTKQQWMEDGNNGREKDKNTKLKRKNNSSA